MKKPGKYTNRRKVNITATIEYRPKVIQNSRTFEVGAYRFERFEHGDLRLVGLGVKTNFLSVAALDQEDVTALIGWLSI